MSEPAPPPSARRVELLERAYRYALEHGLSELSLRPLAAGIGSSPRVLLFLFGSKDGLVRALLARARVDELALLDRAHRSAREGDLISVAQTTWEWLAAEQHRPLLALWLEAYSRSLVEPGGPWAGFARQTVGDWLAVLGTVQDNGHRSSGARAAEGTLALAVLRGALLDLLATGDVERTSKAIRLHLNLVARSRRPLKGSGNTSASRVSKASGKRESRRS